MAPAAIPSTTCLRETDDFLNSGPASLASAVPAEQKAA
eukprot:CAMPEP_0181290184 /NCGR_PEP_ID=MMETSP1101-20121128/1282_1 /TAXON_ID=46948 /ORGANISM="Rhodomonas abbreviata, Strain Caron Lab Isolate" /LENGTH=37 /DNA_ID= /DNA_START= /DNA_END= /DNA_ORIENTATION=